MLTPAPNHNISTICTNIIVPTKSSVHMHQRYAIAQANAMVVPEVEKQNRTWKQVEMGAVSKTMRSLKFDCEMDLNFNFNLHLFLSIHKTH
jgi:hypothetical protein